MWVAGDLGLARSADLADGTSGPQQQARWADRVGGEREGDLRRSGKSCGQWQWSGRDDVRTVCLRPREINANPREPPAASRLHRSVRKQMPGSSRGSRLPTTVDERGDGTGTGGGTLPMSSEKRTHVLPCRQHQPLSYGCLVHRVNTAIVPLEEPMVDERRHENVVGRLRRRQLRQPHERQ